MKKIKLLSIFLLIAFQAVQIYAQNTIGVVSKTANVGEDVILEIALTNADAIAGFQLDIPLPTGFTYKDGTAAHNPARINGHNLYASVIAGNKLRLLSLASPSANYTGSSGVIASFVLENIAGPGEHQFPIENLTFSNTSGVSVAGTAITGTLTVEKVDPEITILPTATAIIYGSQVSTAGLSGGEARYDGSIVTGSFAYVNPTVVPNAGTYSAAVRFTPANTAAYNTVDFNVNITINQRQLQVTATTGQFKLYGADDPANYAYSITGGTLYGTDGLAGILTRATGNNVGFYAIGRGTLNATPTPGNYNINFVSSDYEIRRRPVTIQVTAGQTKIYGAANPASYAYTVPTGALQYSDVWTGALTRNVGEDVGNYPITQGNLEPTNEGNYVITFNSNNYGITQRAIAISAVAKSKVYGNADPALEYNVTSGSLATGDVWAGALSRVVGENTGNRQIQLGTVRIEKSGINVTANYSLAYTAANLSITARPITITADDKSKVFGDTDPVLTYTITPGQLMTGAPYNDVVEGALTRDPGENTGAYIIRRGGLVINDGNSGNNYTLNFQTGTLTVTGRPITIASNAGQGKVYGDADPVLAYTVTAGSLRTGDDFSGALARATGADVGSYAINQGTLVIRDVNGAGTNVSGQYTITWDFPNQFQITPRPVTVTVNTGQSKIYGAADPVFTFTTSNLIGSPTPTGALSRVAGNAVGLYEVLLGTLSYGTNYNITTFSNANRFQITPRALSIQANNQTKTAGHTFAFDGTEFSYDGLVAAYDDNISSVTLTSDGAAPGAAVGNYPIVPSNPVGKGLTNYTISYTNGNFQVVNEITLSLPDMVATNRVYNGNATANISTWGALNGVQTGDVVTLITTSATASFNNQYVGNGKTVTVTGLLLDGADADKYIIVNQTTTANITRRTLNLDSFTASPKVYDGNISVTGTGFSDDRLGSDVLTFTYDAVFESKNVDPARVVSYSNITISGGTDIGNYQLASTVGSTTAAISQRSITGTFVANNKEYDGNTTATVSNLGLVNHIGTDDVALIGGTATFNTIDVGNSKPVILSGASLSGADAPNYILSSVADAAANITVKGIAGSFAANYKVYDGNTSAVVTAGSRNLTGVVSPDDVVLTGGTAVFSDKNVANGKAVTLTGASLTGTHAGNYTLISVANASANITARPLTGTFTADNKVYDGNNSATVVTRNLTGVLSPDVVSLTGGTVTFDNKNVGMNKVVTLSEAALAGADAGNYSLASVNTTLANITAKGITGNFTADNKTYDGNQTATVVTRVLDGVEGIDAVSLAGGTATFLDKNAGTNKVVTLSGASLGGTDAENYTLLGINTTTANINKRGLNLSGFSANNKIYDGTVTATGSFNDDRVLGDLLSFAYTATFASANAGDPVNVDFTFISVSGGADQGNYNLVSTSGTAQAAITAKPVIVTPDPDQYKVFGQADPAELTYQGDDLIGLDVYTGSLSREDGSAVGHYDILPGTLTAGSNYDISLAAELFTIYAHLSVDVNMAEAGTVEIVGGNDLYLSGENATVKATANAEYSFIGWSVDGDDTIVDSGLEYTFAMPGENLKLIANYTSDADYVVTVTINPLGAGSVSGAGSHNEGAVVTLTANNNVGYSFVDWTVDANIAGQITDNTVNPLVFDMPANDVAVTANFAINTYTLTLLANPEGAATQLNGAGDYDYNTVANVSAVAANGYVFVNWTNAAEEVVSTLADFDYTMPADATTLTANFTVVPKYALALVVNPANAGTVSGGGEYEAGTMFAVEAIANEDYKFVSWIKFVDVYDEEGELIGEEEEVVSEEAAFEFEMPAHDQTLIAVFTPKVSAETIMPVSMRMYPNPTRGSVHFDADATIMQVEVFNMNGQLVFTANVDDNSFRLELPEAESGLYFVKVHTSRGVMTHKLQMVR